MIKWRIAWLRSPRRFAYASVTSCCVYTLVFDNSMLADDAAREKDIQQRTAQFTRALNNMKTLARPVVQEAIGSES